MEELNSLEKMFALATAAATLLGLYKITVDTFKPKKREAENVVHADPSGAEALRKCEEIRNQITSMEKLREERYNHINDRLNGHQREINQLQEFDEKIIDIVRENRRKIMALIRKYREKFI